MRCFTSPRAVASGGCRTSFHRFRWSTTIFGAGRPTGAGPNSIRPWCAATASARPPRGSPGVAVLDAQSIKCSERGVLDKGFDGHKKIQGRKRQLLVDTGGLLLAAHVGPAQENDRVGGKAALQMLTQQGFERLHLVLADTGYDGQPLAQWTRVDGWRLETAPGLTGGGGFTPVPTRWVVERSISWLQWDRPLSRDYECETAAAEATIYLSNIDTLFANFNRL